MTEQTLDITDEASTAIGKNLLHFLNKNGCAPPLTEESIKEFQVWQELCMLAINIKNNKIKLKKENVND